MNRQEAIEYNVRTLEAHLGPVLCRSRWVPQDNEKYGEAAEVFGIVDENTAQLHELFYAGGAPDRISHPYVLTSITVSAQRKSGNLIARAIQKARNIGRRQHQITEWRNLDNISLPRDVQVILEASRMTYNARHGFRD